jgi:2-haloacid dehalogenase
VTFDCFGTLVDWNAGFAAALAPLLGRRTPEALTAYHRRERILEAERPFRPYKEIVARGVVDAAREVGAPPGEREARAVVDAWGAMPVFDDVEPMLAALREAGCRLAVLTNCDVDLFQQTERAFRVPFDLVVTAEAVRDYKPSPAHFEAFRQATGARPADWVHVACSWYHDIAPARALAVTRIWLDREDTGEDPGTASARVLSGADVPAAVAALHGEAVA